MRLELIVAALEREDLELEEALRFFEEGIGHIRATREILSETELRIERLLDDGEGGSVLEPDTADTAG
jgi:exodeoxyribonuclease VII small subunit